MVKALYQPAAISVALLALAIGSGFKSAIWLGWLLVAIALGLPVMATVEYVREDRVSRTNPLTLHVAMTSDRSSRTLTVVCTNPTDKPVDNCRVVLAVLSHWSGTEWKPAKYFQPWAALAWADSSATTEARNVGPEASLPSSLVQVGGTFHLPSITWYAPVSQPQALPTGFYQAHLEIHASPRRMLTAVVCFHAESERDNQGLRHVPVPAAEGLTNSPQGNL